MTSRRLRDGFTVIELLVASAIIAIVLGATTALLVQSYQAYRLNQTLSERQQEIEGAVKILSYDVALAGYRGSTLSDMARTFGAPTIEVLKGVSAGGSDRLIVRYFEDSGRLFSSTDSCGSPCTVTFDVDEEEGVRLLYRQEGGSPERGIVQEVESFQVVQYISRGGRECTFGAVVDEGCPPFPGDLAALNVQITFSDGGEWRFPVGITNTQSP